MFSTAETMRDSLITKRVVVNDHVISPDIYKTIAKPSLPDRGVYPTLNHPFRLAVNWSHCQDELFYLNGGGEGELWEAYRVGLGVEVLQHQVIQLVNQPILKVQNSKYSRSEFHFFPLILYCAIQEWLKKN